MRIRAIALFAVLALATAACAGDTTDTGGTGGTETGTGAETGTATGTEAASEATVEVASSDLGDILVDGEGSTLYGFVPDAQGDPTCTDACAENWPPFEGEPQAGEGADEGMLSTVDHPSGVTQVTYNDWPLYHFANDAAPGDTNGQGVGGNWFVVGPDGELIRE